MKVSTRGRYALRIMIDLAEHKSEGYITLKDIAGRQQISEKYLESIIASLSREKYVLAMRGKGGGYRLAKEPEEYTVGSILKLTEGSMSPVACIENGVCECDRAADCRTLPLWQGLDKIIDDYLEGFKLSELLKNPNVAE